MGWATGITRREAGKQDGTAWVEARAELRGSLLLSEVSRLSTPYQEKHIG